MIEARERVNLVNFLAGYPAATCFVCQEAENGDDKTKLIPPYPLYKVHNVHKFTGRANMGLKGGIYIKNFINIREHVNFVNIGVRS